MRFKGLEVRVERKANKRLYLSIDKRDAAIVVRVPKRAAEDDILTFLEMNEDWIKTRREIVLKEMDRSKLFGRDILISYRELKKPLRQGNYFLLPKSRQEDKDYEQNVTEKLRREALRETALGYISQYEKILGVKVSALTIRDTRTRWGSMNTQTGNMNLSVSLLSYPETTTRAVVVHELVHLRIPGHSKAFYKLLYEVLPEYPQAASLLKGNLTEELD